MVDEMRCAVDFGVVRRSNFLSTFSGAGGLDLGLEAAGFHCVGTIEFDPLARETIRLNKPDWCRYEASDICDIADTLNLDDLGLETKEDLDVIAGAPPCQPFSTAGQWAKSGRRGLFDPRADTLDALLNLTIRLKPKLLILENVPGFRSGGGEGKVRNFFQELNKTRRDLNYSVQSKIIDCSDYGVPQRRRRLILVASRIGDLDWELGKPVSRVSWDALHDLEVHPTPEARGKWASLLPSIPEGKNYLWHSSVGGGKEIFGNRTRFWTFLLKLAKDQAAWTLAAKPGPSTGPFHWENRPLSPLEAQRLQTFPQNWILPGTYREQIRLVGNATPPLLAERVGRMLRRRLGLVPKKGRYIFSIPSAGGIPGPEKVLPVEKAFLSRVGEKSAHPGAGLGPSPRTPIANIP